MPVPRSGRSEPLHGERESMATDYDAPRKSEEDQSEESIEEL